MTRLTFPRRRIRSIRPDIDPLESISPVSVLIPGLAPTSPALAAEIDAMPSRSRREMEWVGARDRSLALYASVSTPIRSVPASFVPTSRTTLVMSGPAPGLSFDDVSLVGAGASLAGTDGPGACPSPDAAGQSRPLFDGSGASRTISDPIHGARGLSPSHPNLAAADDDGIRPMSLPPPSILDPNGGGGVISGFTEDSGGSGGSGGGDPSGGGSGGSGGEGHPNKAPIIMGSGGVGSGGVGGVEWTGVEGEYTIPGGVPVGSTPSIAVLGFSDEPGYDEITSVTWAGGTDFRSYFGQDPNQPTPPTMRVQVGVPTYGEGYSFIVDPRPREYNISVFVQYSNGAFGTSHLTFTSVRPDVTFVTVDQGTPKLLRNDPQASIRLDDLPLAPGADPAEGHGMHIKVQTATKQFGGDFMFLQLITPQRYTRGISGRHYHQTIRPGHSSPAIDNSFPGFAGRIGYPVTERDMSLRSSRNDMLGWRSADNETETFQMIDSPVTPPVPWNSWNVQVGNMTHHAPERFDTYVMYRPAEGEVWVALAKVHWEWGHLASRDLNGIWVEQAFPAGDLSPPSTVDSSNPEYETSEYFPGWGDTSQGIIQNGWVLYLP